MRTISILPDNDPHNGWSALLPKRSPKPVLEHELEAEFLVIGGGFAGLAAARRLAELRPGADIIVLEAEQVGEGAQGRNSGFAIDIPHNVGSSLAELAQAEQHARLSRAAIDALKAAVDAHQIDCDWRQDGKYHTAVSQRGVKQVLVPTRQMLDSLNEPYEWLEGAALHDRVGFEHYSTGIYTPGTVLLNPSALARGLADSLPKNVQLFEYSPVISLDLSMDVLARTPAGTVRAKKLILAVNGFIEQFGFYGGRLIHLAAHASLTEPMNEDQQKAMSGQRSWGITPANALVGTTLRRTPDQRLLIRQHMQYLPKLAFDHEARADIQKKHQDILKQRFPMVDGLKLEYTWTGFICMSRNGAHGFGRLAPNVFGAVCQNGVGITKGTIGGLLAAELACDEKSELLDLMLRLEAPAALLPQPFLGLGVRGRIAWEKWRERAEF